MNILITGASKGIGKAITEAFVKEGHHVAICSRNEKDLAQLSSDLFEMFPRSRVIYKETDCSHKNQLLDFAEYAKAEFGSIDILVNNVGTYIHGSMLQENDHIFEKMMRTNVHAAYHLCRFFVPDMIHAGKGHIFNICSIAGIRPFINAGSYSISKFALYGMTKVLREELKEHGIKVTAVIPGATISQSWEGTTLPDSRFVLPEDIASAIINAVQMSAGAVMDEIIIRPALGEI